MIDWITSPGQTAYPDAVAAMEQRAAAIRDGRADECIWLVEHPPLYTAGASAKPQDLVDSARFPVFETRRGGQYTYHGPGQRIAYVMLDLDRRGRDVRRFVTGLEDWVIDTLAEFGVRGERRAGRVGVWVTRPEKPPCPTAPRARTRSPPSASSCAAGSAFTASRSTTSPICAITTASCPAASPATA
jgi:lipoyl(octanoyl) transferase